MTPSDIDKMVEENGTLKHENKQTKILQLRTQMFQKEQNRLESKIILKILSPFMANQGQFYSIFKHTVADLVTFLHLTSEVKIFFICYLVPIL